ncbi:hypothetical protein CPB85DRAFT_1274682 [Mucidula mucida]|nr:hypothetical protein CPB85DRAFT_1274682 [Mucidula mucida]
MFSPFLKYTALAAVIAGVIAQSTLTINTPGNVVTCQPTLLSWTGGQSPYQLFITSGDDSSGPTIEDLGTQTDNSETYTPSQQANTRIVFNIRDSTGLIAQTGIITVGAGSSTSLTLLHAFVLSILCL